MLEYKLNRLPFRAGWARQHGEVTNKYGNQHAWLPIAGKGSEHHDDAVITTMWKDKRFPVENIINLFHSLGLQQTVLLEKRLGYKACLPNLLAYLSKKSVIFSTPFMTWQKCDTLIKTWPLNQDPAFRPALYLVS